MAGGNTSVIKGWLLIFAILITANALADLYSSMEVQKNQALAGTPIGISAIAISIVSLLGFAATLCIFLEKKLGRTLAIVYSAFTLVFGALGVITVVAAPQLVPGIVSAAQDIPALIIGAIRGIVLPAIVIVYFFKSPYAKTVLVK